VEVIYSNYISNGPYVAAHNDIAILKVELTFDFNSSFLKPVSLIIADAFDPPSMFKLDFNSS
jgi:hypothetical protein